MASAINKYLTVSSVTCFTAIIVVSMMTSSASKDFCTTPRLSNCSCTISYNTILQLQCLTFAAEFDLHYRVMNIHCTNHMSNFSVLNYMQIGEIRELAVKQCPLFPVEDIGVYGTRTLKIIEPEVRDIVSPRTLLHGLINVTDLVLQTADITIFSDAFSEMPELLDLELVFNNTALTKTTFCSAPNVHYLYLTNNNVTYLQPGIFYCQTQLKYLVLNGNVCNITRSVFTDIQKLTYLAIMSNKLSILPADVFTDLTMLDTVDLESNEWLSVPENLLKGKTLLKTILFQNNIITIRTLPSGFLANLTELRDVKITNNTLNNLPQDLFWGSELIEYVSLTRNNFTSLPHLLFRDCYNLRDLSVDFNQITHLPRRLFSNTRTLERLKLNNNQLTYIENDMFNNLRELEHLDLANNRIKHVGERAFPQNLKVIIMTHNFLTGFPYLISSKLEHIEFANNSLTSIQPEWTKMEFLKHLNLSHNQISRLQAADLQFETNQNIVVDLSFNRINKINFSNVNTVYRLPLEYEKHFVNSLKQRYIYTVGNTFYDHCQVYWLVELKWKKYHSVIFFRSDKSQYFQPTSHVSLVEYIPLKKLTCLLTEVDNPTCPDQCSCLYRFSDDSLLVNCDQRNCSSMPKAVPDVNFSSYTVLNLTRNNIKSIKPPLGPGYHKVIKYILSENEISEIDLTAFSPGLQVLEINGNRITQFNKSTIEFLKNATNLIQLTLHQNPWKCDCATEDTVELIAFFYNVKKIEQLDVTTCENGKFVWNIPQAELCPVDSEIFIILTLLAFGLLIGIIHLYYRFQTEIKIWLYAHRCCLRFISEEELDREKVYDAFVSYAQPDEDFVIDDLMPGLENGPIRYRLCLHQRDWIPGEMIPTQIARSVEESRRTIIVLSKHFLNSTWARMEFCTAHMQALSERRVRLIVIMYGDIGQTNKLDAELRAYLTMNTYVKWGDPFFWEKLRYALPRRL